MWRLRVVLLLCQANLVFTFSSESLGLPKKNCVPMSKVLNDCNWCTCHKGTFHCQTRNCEQVDVFGHFNDAIQPIKVGMEGHGAWRSGSHTSGLETRCTPDMHYINSDLVCVCTNSGTWPHEKCQKVFNKLHAVESTLKSFDEECKPRLIYLVQCHTCVCDNTGHISNDYCIPMECTKESPVLLESPVASFRSVVNTNQETYADCLEGVIYKDGCKTCVCKNGNRLFCDDSACGTVSAGRRRSIDNSKHCIGKSPGATFELRCRSCFCDKYRRLICLKKMCLSTDSKNTKEFLLRTEDSTPPVLVEAPIDDRECVPNTIYKKGCNICECLLGANGQKLLACTQKACISSARLQPVDIELIEIIKNDCVEGTVYVVDCRKCHCTSQDGVKTEICAVESVCDEQTVKSEKPGDLSTLHGYCEPLHVYRSGCETCQCLADGKVVRCTTNANCVGRDSNPRNINVEILPINLKDGSRCPSGGSYKVDCNYCYCLPNGNALCTTAKCPKKRYN